jgi:hypothetical protein
MKKLRIIVTSVIVLAIVGSAFAFNAKKQAAFCVRISAMPPTTNCNAVIRDQFVDPNGATFGYYNGWDGQFTTCTGNHCTTLINLSGN